MDPKYATNHPVSGTRDYEPRIAYKFYKKLKKLNGDHWKLRHNDLNRLVAHSYYVDKR